MHDIVIVGGGPAGLTAAIKAGTEGLSALVIERDLIGGRPVQSPLIENVPGWPEGIDGPTLFGRMREQAEKFGATFVTGEAVIGMHRLTPADQEPHLGLTTMDGQGYAAYKGRSVVLAMGEVTPRLEALEPFVGRGVDYSCDAALLDQHAGQHVVLVGGGNSCAQLGLAIAETDAKSVTIVSRSPIATTTSMYLRQRLAGSRVKVVIGEVEKAYGRWDYGGAYDGGDVERLHAVKVVRGPNFAKTVEADQTYVYITGVPPTGWFPGALNEQGYVLTGVDVPWQTWTEPEPGRDPYPHETSIPGVFAAGDVRAGSTGGITVALGEGTQAFQWIKREYLPGLEQGPSTGAQCISPEREEALRA
jgi:thioredoxin reductase (NADPH)